MESRAALDLWKRSESLRKMRYMTMLSDGDTNSWTLVNSEKPYGEGKYIKKEECINHVHKRLANRLKKLQHKEIIYDNQSKESDMSQSTEEEYKGKVTKDQKVKGTDKNSNKDTNKEPEKKQAKQ